MDPKLMKHRQWLAERSLVAGLRRIVKALDLPEQPLLANDWHATSKQDEWPMLMAETLATFANALADHVESQPAKKRK